MPGREHDRGFRGVGNVLLFDLSAGCTGMYVCVHSTVFLWYVHFLCVLYLNRNFYYSMLLILVNYFDKSRQNSPNKKAIFKFVYFQDDCNVFWVLFSVVSLILLKMIYEKIKVPWLLMLPCWISEVHTRDWYRIQWCQREKCVSRTQNL